MFIKLVVILYVPKNNDFAIEGPHKIKMIISLVLIYFYFISLQTLANIKIIKVIVEFR